jgi:tetratricopeptide (TPR) repeat protein
VSLLLEALKKAELAKQNASGQQGEGAAAPVEPASGLSLEPAPGDVAAERPLITRDRLPDITQPLEILSEDLPSAGARREAPPSTPAPSAVPLGSAPTLPAPEDDERASARQLFEAKTPDYDPRRPFFIVVGLLGVAILGTMGYFAWEYFGPRPSFYGTRAATQAPQPVTAAAPPPPQPPAASPAPAAAAPTPSEPAPAASAAPATTAQAAPAAAAAAVPPAPQPTPSGATRQSRPEPSRPAAVKPTPAATTAQGEPGEPRAAAPRAPVRVTPGGPRVDPAVESAWEALQAGDLQRARDGYQRALRANPRDRDALLGMATIDARSQDFESAEVRYLRVLELDPRDPYATAGLIALRGQTDPLQSESRIKNMLAQQPDAAFLNFPLGNQYAAQGRWSEAQAAYFKAFSADPENADYAYNLAVSLDHIGQGKLALEYYRRALALAGNRAVGFNSAQVEARIRELTR